MCHRKLRRIADVLQAAGSDVMVLQEIENPRVLHALARMMKGSFHVAIDSLCPGPATRAAVLSRSAIRRTVSHAVGFDGGTLPRPILEVELLLGATPIFIFANHWPSRRHPSSQRLAAAATLARRLAQLPDSADYLIAGDLNLDYSTESGQSEYDSVIDLLSGATGRRFHNPWSELPENRRCSYIYRNKPHTPDHFLLPASLLDSAGPSYTRGSFRVFRWNGRLLHRRKPYRWRRRWVRGVVYHTGEGFSDHLPLIIELRIEK